MYKRYGQQNIHLKGNLQEADYVFGRLKNLERILYVGAHPDDENNRLMSYLHYEKGCEVAYLSLTRGEGGQNFIGSEHGLDLAILREAESVAAGKLDGARRFFTRAIDFGFTDSKQEALNIWLDQGVLRDIVWCIRYFCPDIIISRFSPAMHDLHGQHDAAAELICRSHEISLDPSVFPEQLIDLEPWQAEWIFWNVYSEAGMKDIGGEVVPRDNYCSLEIPRSSEICDLEYNHLAYQARRSHRSQNMGEKNVSYSKIEYFEEISDKEFSGRWFPLGLSCKYQDPHVQDYFNYLDRSSSVFDRSNTDELLNFLCKGAFLLKAVKKSWIEKKISEIEELIVSAVGIRFQVNSNLAYWTGMEEVKVDFSMEVGGRDNVRLTFFEVAALDNLTKIDQRSGPIYSGSIRGKPDCLLYHEFLPRWYRARNSENSQLMVQSRDFVLPSEDLVQRAVFKIDVNGYILDVVVPISSPESVDSFDDYGEFVIACPAVIGKFHKELSFIGSIDRTEFTLDLTSFLEFTTTGSLQIVDYSSGEILSGVHRVTLDPQSPISVEFNILSEVLHSISNLGYQIICMGKLFSQTIVPINVQDYYPKKCYYPKARMQITGKGFSSLATRVAYVQGSVAMTEVLQQISKELSVIGLQELFSENLSVYDAIILGPGIPLTDVNRYDFERVCDGFIINGGILVCGHNTFYQEEKLSLAGFTVGKSRKRLSNPKGKVIFPDSVSPVFMRPNQIDQEDFLHWEGDIAVRLPEAWEGGMDSILSGIDEYGERMDGLLLVGRSKKGCLVYSCLTLFKRLIKGDELAFKLLSNIVSLGK